MIFVGSQHVFHVSGIDVVSYFGKTNPQYTVGLVHVSKFMSGTPEIEVSRRSRISQRINGNAESIVACMIESTTRSYGNNRHVVLRLAIVFVKTHDLMFKCHDAVVCLYKPLTIGRTILFQCLHGEYTLDVLAFEVHTVAFRIRQQFHPIGIGISTLNVEVTILITVDEVNLHVWRILIIRSEIVDIAISLMLATNHVDTVGQWIIVGGEVGRTEVSYL